MVAILGMSILGIPTAHQQLASLTLISHVDSLRHGNQLVVVDFGAQYGIVYYHAGQYEEAKGLYLAQLAKQKQVLGDEHPDTLWVMGDLALTYEGLGQYKQAEELQVVVLEILKHVHGYDHPETLLAMNNLASTYGHLGRFHKAAELAVVVLEKRKQAFGDAHPDTLQAMGDLASIYWQLGKFQQAEELQVIVLEKRKQVLGDDHPDTLQAMGNLASTYRVLGELHKAEDLEVAVLEKRKQALGDDHPVTLWAMGSLASTYHILLSGVEGLREVPRYVPRHLRKICHRRSTESCSGRPWLSKIIHQRKGIRCVLIPHLEMAGQTGAALASVSVEIEIDAQQRIIQNSRENFPNTAQGLEQYLRCHGGRER
jgi:tetratricopeptide (TPR) repeat protein